MSKEVRHQQFYLEVLNKIKSGELKQGEKLPAERTLCDMYNISRTTVREALRNLEVEGYIERKQGSGNFVKIKPLEQKLEKLYTLRNMFVEQGIKHEVQLLEYKEMKCSQEVADQLQIPVHDEIIYIVRVFLAAGVPYTIEYTYLPKGHLKKMTKEMVINDGLYNTLERFGEKPVSAVETIKAVKINDDQKNILKVQDDILAIESRRITHSEAKVIEYTQNIIRNDYFVYTVNLD